MEVGDYVKVSGTKLVGKIIESNPRRLQDRRALISFYLVYFPDGTKMEYGREELRHADEADYRLAALEHHLTR